MLKNIGLFCKRDLQKRPIFCKETYIFKHPTNRSHPISRSIAIDSFDRLHSHTLCKARYTPKRALYTLKRALHTPERVDRDRLLGQTPLHTLCTALYTPKRALCTLKRALHTLERAQHIFQKPSTHTEGPCVRSKKPCIHSKEPCENSEEPC